MAAPLSGAIIAVGQVKSAGERKVVSHANGGIVRTVHVREGDKAIAGDPVMTLADVRVHASLEAFHVAQNGLRARIARLTSERDNLEIVIFPAELPSPRLHGGFTDLVRKERRLFESRRAALLQHQALLHFQVEAADDEIRGLERLVGTSEQSLALMVEELRANEALEGTGFVSRLRVVQMQRQTKDYQTKHETQLVDVDRARQRRGDLHVRISSLRNDFVSRAAEELREATGQLLKLREDLRPIEDEANRQVVVAPVTGTVVGLRVHTEGIAVGPRETLMELVPAEASQLIEIRIRPEDIVEARKTQRVEVRLSGYKSRDIPSIFGMVDYIGADREIDIATQEQYYVARVNVAPESVEHARTMSNVPIRLEPGMTAEVIFQTTPRTVFAYLLDPLASGIRRSMREP